ncbi:class I SAM-dependent methyltransferase [bacterium]|nr:class I SAM-dependent methyltransferase [bacterium]
MNARHWSETLDAANLGREESQVDTERQLALYETADVRLALDAMEPLRDKWTVDLGGGLALGAILLARRGARVVISDLSVPRMKAARETVRRLGLEDRIHFVVAKGETLPFADGAVERLFTKSVLIHTDLPHAARECGRVLARDGRAAFIEPMRRNPFVNLYRRLLAPKIWTEITTYFRPAEFRTLRKGMGKSRQARLEPMYFLGFFASAFQFALPHPKIARILEGVFLRIDRVLFRALPSLRKHAWFGVLVISPGEGKHRPRKANAKRHSAK